VLLNGCGGYSSPAYEAKQGTFIVALSRQSMMREGYARVHMQFLKAGPWYFAQIPMLPSSKCWMRIGIPEETAVMHNRGPLQSHSPCSNATHPVLFAVKKAKLA
jgi:hypothetical protein